MNYRLVHKIFAIFLVGLLTMVGGCAKQSKQDAVVIYTSVDQVFAEPVLQNFEKQAGIKVQAVYDVEAAKTTGLVNRLIAEKDNPRADVFWNGEFVQTLLLKEQGVLAPFTSPAIQDLPAAYHDPEGYWAGAGGRARVILVNTELLNAADYPHSIYDFLDKNVPAEKIGIANPLFGTTATHAAALYALLGPEQGREYFTELQARSVQVVDGNSVVRDMVADGRLTMGLTDTDDAIGALEKGAPVKIIFPDQEDMGTLVIPYTVGMVAGGPNPQSAQSLVDYLLSADVEKAMIESGFNQVPARSLDIDTTYIDAREIKRMNIDFSAIYNELETIQEELREIFLR